VRGDYAYVVGWGVWVIDVSDPTAPTQASYLDMPAVAQDVTVEGEYAYVVSPIWFGDQSTWGQLRVVDISDPTAPIGVSFYYLPQEPERVFVTNGDAYVSGKWAGLYILRLFRPTNQSFFPLVYR
jgi:hypothetical protein